MATSLTLTRNGQSRSRTAQNDARVDEVLTRFARVRGLPEGATEAQRADFILTELVAWMVQEARREYVNAQRATQEAEAETNVGFE